MNPITWILMALEGIGRLASDERVGGDRGVKVALALEMLRTLIAGGQEMNEALKAFALEIKGMADADVEPSDEQWRSMADRDTAARAALSEAKARLLSGVDDPSA